MEKLIRERWTLVKWTPMNVVIQTDTLLRRTVPLDKLTGWSIAGINKISTGEQFDRVYYRDSRGVEVG